MISFNPPLSSCTTVPLPSAHSSSQSVLKLTLHASVSGEDLHGAQIQCWTDLPSQGKDAGAWGEITFEEVQDDIDTFQRSGTEISLLPNEEPPHDSSTKYQAVVSLPLPSPQDKFSFTYRLLHPSGHITWLGDANSNGTIAIAGLGAWEPSDGWSSPPDGVPTWSRQNGSAKVGSLAQDVKWSGWALTSEGPYMFDVPTTLPPPSSTIVLFPRAPADAIVTPEAFVLNANTQDLIITPSFEILFQGHGQLTARPVTSGVIAAGIDLVSDNTDFAILSHSRAIHIVPTADHLPAVNKVTIPAFDISGAASRITLFSPAMNQGFVVDSHSYIDVLVGPQGATLIATPSYSLADEWSVGILTSSSLHVSTAHDVAPSSVALQSKPVSPPFKFVDELKHLSLYIFYLIAFILASQLGTRSPTPPKSPPFAAPQSPTPSEGDDLTEVGEAQKLAFDLPSREEKTVSIVLSSINKGASVDELSLRIDGKEVPLQNVSTLVGDDTWLVIVETAAHGASALEVTLKA